MFQVKICGIRSPEIAAWCSEVGVDAIGLNFYQASKRSIDPTTAAEIVAAVNPGTLTVGLFVNHDPEWVVQQAQKLKLDSIQLHGDETLDHLRMIEDMQLPESIKVIRAVRIGPTNLEKALDEINLWSSAPVGNRMGGILLDPLVEKSFGGTGQPIDWQWLANLTLPTDLPLILAGGLTPENVATAINIVRPAGVDVAGGVEDRPGQKNKDLIKSFAANARAALGTS